MFRVMNVGVSGPLGPLAQGLADYLLARGYAPATISSRMCVFAHLSRWLESERVVPEDCDEVTVARFLAAWRVDHRDRSTPFAVAQLVVFLRLAGIVPDAAPTVTRLGPVAVVLARWGEYLVQERGVKEESIRQYQRLASPFLTSRLRGDAVDLAGVDARVVSAFIRDHVPGLPVVTASRTLTALRSLLRFLFITGVLSDRLEGVVPSRRISRAGLPCGLSAPQVELMMSAIDLSSRSGIRDRAILMLLSRLGLRVNEVASMTVDDFDWRAGTVRVRGKGGQLDVLPIPVDVGAALAAYLQQPRHPATAGRAVFSGVAAPYRPLTAGAVIAVVGAAGRRAGLGTVAAHQLRHTVATSTINAGATLEEVAQLLRHRTLASTMIYAKVDLTRLATLVRPWPGSGASSPEGVL